MSLRIGIGYDIHKLVDRRPLMLGGINIPYEKGLEGHSDGDSLLHAICDSLLGACGLEDIGHQFPVDDSKYLNIKSLELLSIVSEKIKKKGYKVCNIDSVIITEEPKIAPYRDKMILAISKCLGIKKDEINIKATTQEGIGAIGRKEAIASYAVCILEKI